MPNRDKTGPQGEGPKTGRGMGDCENKNDKQPVIRNDRRGLGRSSSQKSNGRGLGRNRAN